MALAIITGASRGIGRSVSYYYYFYCLFFYFFNFMDKPNTSKILFEWGNNIIIYRFKKKKKLCYLKGRFV